MNEVQNGTTFLQNLLGTVGRDGVKLDFKVELENQTYVKLGATFLVTFVVCLLMWTMFRTITK